MTGNERYTELVCGGEFRLMFGDTAFGVRVVSILLALPMTFAVYRAAEMLFRDAKIAATAADLRLPS